MKDVSIKKNNDYVLGIGACNIDIYGKPQCDIRPHYDHPAIIGSNVGGVSKNILTNLCKLGSNVKFITAIGDDGFADAIIKDCKLNKINTSNIIRVENQSSGVFMQVQDKNNDMYLAVCDMSALNAITPEYIRSKKSLLLKAKLVLVDSSFRLETLQEIIDICKDNVPIYVDPISDNYATKIKDYVKYFTCIKANRTELECLSEIKISNRKDLYKACDKLLNDGLKRIFVSLGKDGILYMDNKGNKLIRKLKPEKRMVNASGAGDASMAAIIYSTINNLSLDKTVDYALAAGIAAIRSQETINKDMSIGLLNRILKENE